MKKLFIALFVGLLMVGLNAPVSLAQDVDSIEVVDGDSASNAAADSAAVDTSNVVPQDEEPVDSAIDLTENGESSDDNLTSFQLIKRYFIEGGPFFMGIVMLCLILGLAVSIERIVMLSLSDENVDRLIEDVDSAMATGGAEAAKEVCRTRRGPIASIFFQGLSRVNEGMAVVEKTIVAYGSVQMGRMEKGLVWIALFIAIAPMLGFMGTVIGLITAFNDIAIADDISPSIVANGMKVALLTTLAGLIVAVILQLFYNYIVSKIDNIVNNMEDASITLFDLITKHSVSK